MPRDKTEALALAGTFRTFQYLGTRILIPPFTKEQMTHKSVTQKWDTGSLVEAFCHSEQILKGRLSVWQYRDHRNTLGVGAPCESNHKGSWGPRTWPEFVPAIPFPPRCNTKAKTVG